MRKIVASTTQVSSGGSDLEGKTQKKTYGSTIQDDNAKTESGENESEVELLKQSSKERRNCKKRKRRLKRERSDI